MSYHRVNQPYTCSLLFIRDLSAEKSLIVCPVQTNPFKQASYEVEVPTSSKTTDS
jgi:hypothetical protein